MAEHPEKIVVIGAGVMGRGIAHVAALSGHETTLVEPDASIGEAALAQITANLDKGIARGKTSEEEKATTLDNLSLATSFEAAAAAAALVVEAVPERMDLKKKIFSALGEVTAADCILGTNTSSLSVDEIAQTAAHPERVIGTHFFNPVHIVKLLEIVVPDGTSEATLETTRMFGERMNREMITVKDSPGFATSRLGLALGLEAIRMVETGVASAEDIDRGMELGYRHPMGPLKLTDLVGLDTRLKIAEYLYETLGSDSFRPPELMKQMVADGKLGKKSGQGFYTW
jgi:3-hydroxybutyryl-CoA dehydrogenase